MTATAPDTNPRWNAQRRRGISVTWRPFFVIRTTHDMDREPPVGAASPCECTHAHMHTCAHQNRRSGCLIEAPWLVTGGHGAPLTAREHPHRGRRPPGAHRLWAVEADDGGPDLHAVRHLFTLSASFPENVLWLGVATHMLRAPLLCMIS
eukprot:COSAG01_NODE_6738_length_3522_cov_4.122407_1_plen_150_part_00